MQITINGSESRIYSPMGPQVTRMVKYIDNDKTFFHSVFRQLEITFPFSIWFQYHPLETTEKAWIANSWKLPKLIPEIRRKVEKVYYHPFQNSPYLQNVSSVFQYVSQSESWQSPLFRHGYLKNTQSALYKSFARQYNRSYSFRISTLYMSNQTIILL